jgi:hypothetical protein
MSVIEASLGKLAWDLSEKETTKAKKTGGMTQVVDSLVASLRRGPDFNPPYWKKSEDISIF